MSEPKTLKDIERIEKAHEFCFSNELKQFVINCIKEDIEVYRNANLNLPQGEQGIAIHNFIVQRRQFWKDKFDITKGDLQ